MWRKSDIMWFLFHSSMCVCESECGPCSVFVEAKRFLTFWIRSHRIGKFSLHSDKFIDVHRVLAACRVYVCLSCVLCGCGYCLCASLLPSKLCVAFRTVVKLFSSHTFFWSSNGSKHTHHIHTHLRCWRLISTVYIHTQYARTHKIQCVCCSAGRGSNFQFIFNARNIDARTKRTEFSSSHCHIIITIDATFEAKNQTIPHRFRTYRIIFSFSLSGIRYFWTFHLKCENSHNHNNSFLCNSPSVERCSRSKFRVSSEKASVQKQTRKKLSNPSATIEWPSREKNIFQPINKSNIQID